MTDLDMTELCLAAMGWKHLGAVGVEPPKRGEPDPKGRWCLSGGNDWWINPEGHDVCAPCSGLPDPLHDDAQAMALVKSETLDVTWGPGELRWRVGQFRFGKDQGMSGSDGLFCEVRSTDLNRAIVECVAKMQAATAPPQ